MVSTAKKVPAANPGSTTRKTTAGRKTAHTNGNKAALAKTNGTKPATKRKPVRNPASDVMNSVLLALGGALAINVFDEAIAFVWPTITTPISIGGKVVAGWAAGRFLKPYIGAWATVAQGALWLSAALQGFSAYIRPEIARWLPSGTTSPTPVGQTDTVKNTATGQMGTRIYMSDGNSYDVFPPSEQQGMAYA